MDNQEPIEVFPPAWFVENFNIEPTAAGQPYRTATDPLVMYSWHLATAGLRHPQPLCIVTGIA